MRKSWNRIAAVCISVCLLLAGLVIPSGAAYYAIQFTHPEWGWEYTGYHFNSEIEGYSEAPQKTFAIDTIGFSATADDFSVSELNYFTAELNEDSSGTVLINVAPLVGLQPDEDYDESVRITASVNGQDVFADLRLGFFVEIHPDYVNEIWLYPNSITVAVNYTVQLDYEIYPETAKNQNITFISENPSVARVDSQGAVTGVGPGKTEITVITEEGGYQDSCLVTVIPYASVESFQINCSTANMGVGGVRRLSTTVYPAGAYADFTWHSSDPSVVSITSGSQWFEDTYVLNGVWAEALSPGTAVITATTDTGVESSITLTVLPREYIFEDVTGIPFAHPDYPDLKNMVLKSGETIRFDILPEQFKFSRADAPWDTTGPDVINMAVLESNSLSVVYRKMPSDSRPIKDIQIIELDGKAYIELSVVETATDLDATEYEVSYAHKRMRLSESSVLMVITVEGSGDDGNGGNDGNGGDDGNNGNSGSMGGGGSSYNGSSYSNTGRTASTASAVISQSTFSALNVDSALEATQKAIDAAGASGFATVRVTNVDVVPRAVFQAMREQAQKAGITSLAFQADSLTADRSAVAVRITLDAFQVTRNMNLSASTESTQAIRTKNSFEKWFSNKIAVISFGQTGGFGQTVSVAAKINLTGMNTDNLEFYSYDYTTNTFVRLQISYHLDRNEYLCFTTDIGGDIIISDGPLTA